MTTTATAVLLTLLVAAGVAGWFFRTQHDAYLRDRVPDLSRWERLYPSAALPTVMAALRTIRDAFLLHDPDIYRLQPDDRLIDLYRATYPHGGGDSMEFEELSLMLTRGHGVPEQEITHLDSLTVSDIIQLCLSHATNVA